MIYYNYVTICQLLPSEVCPTTANEVTEITPMVNTSTSDNLSGGLQISELSLLVSITKQLVIGINVVR